MASCSGSAIEEFVAIPRERIRLLRGEKVHKLEEVAGVKITLDEGLTIRGDDPLQVMRVRQVLTAFGRGFDLDTAMGLLGEGLALVIVDIKEWAGRSRSRLATLRGRVIGTGGKTKRLIQRYTGARLAIYGKTVAIMGEWAAVELARQAVEMLLAGRAHSTVYRFLEVRG